VSAPWNRRCRTVPTVDVLELKGAAVDGLWCIQIVLRNVNRGRTVDVAVEHNDGQGHPAAILDVPALGAWWSHQPGGCVINGERPGINSCHNQSGDERPE